MSVHRVAVAGERVRLTVLPPAWPDAVAAFRRFVASAPAAVLGLDVESTAIETGKAHPCFDPSARLRMVQLGTRTAAWALDPHEPAWREQLAAVLADPALRFVSHTNYDPLWVLREFGIDLAEQHRAIDTHPMACLLYPGERNDHSLKGLTERFIDAGLREAETALHARFKELAPKGERVGRKLLSWGFTNCPLDDPCFARYAALDAVYVRILLDVLAAKLRRNAATARLARREQRISALAIGMQARGMRLDVDYTQGLLDGIEAEYAEADARLRAVLGFSPLSLKLRAQWLLDHGLVVRRESEVTAGGLPKLDKATLPVLARRYAEHEIGPVLADLDVLSRRRNLLSNLRNLLAARDVAGAVHPTIRTLAAVTGRMSVVSPAMQTFKKTDPRLRGCFVTRPGRVFVGADYDSQEIRLAAAFSRDPALLVIIERGLNQHDETARLIFGEGFTPEQRHIAKTLNFAQQYGAGPRRITEQLDVPYARARELWQRWRDAYADLVAWTERLAREAYVVNPWGRLIPRDAYRHYANGNYLIQSSGRDVLGDALVRLDDAGWGELLWLPIHDEIILEVPEAEAEDACAALSAAMRAKVEGVELTASAKVIGTRWSGED